MFASSDWPFPFLSGSRRSGWTGFSMHTLFLSTQATTDRSFAFGGGSLKPSLLPVILSLVGRGIAGRRLVGWWGKNSRVGLDGFVGLRVALAQELVEDDGAEGSNADAADGETADDEAGVADHACADC